MKNNIEYYQHFCNSDQHPKFKMLRVEYGWGGEGKFWALNNRIGLADDCKLDLNKKYNKASIANDLNFTLKELDKFIQYLDIECNLIIKENGFITTEIVIENLDRVMNKRKRNQIDYKSKIKESLRNIKKSKSGIKTSENIQSKVKESKVNKTKIKEMKECVDFYGSFLKEESVPLKNFKKNYNSYLECCDKLMRIDGYTKDEIIGSIKNAMNHKGSGDFSWRDQFQSFNKLRKRNEKAGVNHIVIFAGLKQNQKKYTSPEEADEKLKIMEENKKLKPEYTEKTGGNNA